MTRSILVTRRLTTGIALQALGISAALLMGCSTAGAPLSAARPSPLVAPEESDSVQPGMETEQGEIDPPIDYTPDQFWAMMTSQPDFTPTTANLREAFQAADLIILGQAVDVVEADGFGGPGEPTMWYADAVIDVTEVLKGKPSLDESGLLHIPFAIGMTLDDAYPNKVLKDFQRSMAKEPALLLLTSWETYLDAAGADPPNWMGLDRSDRYRTIGPEGAMRVTAAGVQPPLAEGWAQELAVTSLSELKRQIAEQSPTP